MKFTHNQLCKFVQQWLKISWGCDATAVDRGTRAFRMDTVGRIVKKVRNLNDGLITVEVKLNKKRFFLSLCQALGYGMFTNRTYLAVFVGKEQQIYSYEDVLIARLFGVGLLEITSDGQVKEILPAVYHKPIDYFKSIIGSHLGYSARKIYSAHYERDEILLADDDMINNGEIENTGWFFKLIGKNEGFCNVGKGAICC